MLKFHQASTVLLLAPHSHLAELISQVKDKIPEVDPEGLCSQVKTKFKFKSSACIRKGPFHRASLTACQCVVAFLPSYRLYSREKSRLDMGGIRTGRVSPRLAMAGVLIDATTVIWNKSALLPNILWDASVLYPNTNSDILPHEWIMQVAVSSQERFNLY